MDALIFEKGEHVYLVGSVAPFSPAEPEIEELAFAGALRTQAPNEHIRWLRGQYVDSEKANLNGHIWSASELRFSSLTPRLMPVTVMHDPRTAVGLIADVSLVDRGDDHQGLDTTLGLWQHRFPDVVAECEENYKRGGLMQSMECLPAYYDCAHEGCGRRFPQMGGEEAKNWCEHLKAGEYAAAKTRAPRRLGNVTFTGTGLIFETRGARGANPQAHLDLEEVAEFHEQAARDRTSTRPRRKRKMELEDRDYQALLADQTKARDLEKRVPELEAEAAKVSELERKVEEAEAAKTKAETERDDFKTKVDEAAEESRKTTLAGERFESLGSGFKAKLGKFTKDRLQEQAKSLSDEEWEARLKEIEETAGVKRDEGGESGSKSGSGGEIFSREEAARAGGSGGGPAAGGNGGEPSESKRRSVVAGLRRKS